MDMRTIEKLEGTMPETNLAKNWSEQMTDYYKNIEIQEESEARNKNKRREQMFQEKVLDILRYITQRTGLDHLTVQINELRGLIGDK